MTRLSVGVPDLVDHALPARRVTQHRHITVTGVTLVDAAEDRPESSEGSRAHDTGTSTEPALDQAT